MYRIINKKKLWATRLADALGALLFAPLRLLRPSQAIDPAEIQSILLIRTAYIGDVVMTTPLLRPLRERFPRAKITFLTSRASAKVLQNNPYVDEIITYDPFWFYPTPVSAYWPFIKSLRERDFDLIIEARGDIREFLLLLAPLKARFKVSYGVGGGAYLLTHVVPHPAINHRVDYHLDIARFLGAKVNPGQLDWGLYLSQSELDEAGQILAKAGLRGEYLCLHPGSRLALKRLAPEKYAALAESLAREYGLTPVLLGAPGETGIAAEVAAKLHVLALDLSGKLGLRQMAAVLAGAGLFLCNDSAPMHIAAAQGVPTLAFFGPSKSRETGPYSPNSRVVEKDFPCRYCCDESSCKFPRLGACIAEISVEDALCAARELLGPARKTHPEEINERA